MIPFAATFVINLDRSPERLAHTLALAEAAGLPAVERVSAVDGRELDEAAIAALRAGGTLAEGAGGFRPEAWLAEVACAATHIRVLREVVRRDLRAALVLEDDIALPCRADEWRPRFAAASAVLPPDWELWYLCRCLDSRRLARRLNRYTVVPWSPVGASAYAVTLEGARKLLAGVVPLTRPIDDSYVRVVYRKQIRAYAASPRLVIPGDFPSLINDGVPGAVIRGGVNRPPEWRPYTWWLKRVFRTVTLQRRRGERRPRRA